MIFIYFIVHLFTRYSYLQFPVNLLSILRLQSTYRFILTISSLINMSPMISISIILHKRILNYPQKHFHCNNGTSKPSSLKTIILIMDLVLALSGPSSTDVKSDLLDWRCYSKQGFKSSCLEWFYAWLVGRHSRWEAVSRNATTLRYKRKFCLNFFINHTPTVRIRARVRSFITDTMSANFLVSYVTLL